MRQFKSIFTELRDKTTFDRNLADELAAYSVKHKLDLYAEFFAVDRGLSSHVMETWTTADVRAYLEKRMAMLEAASEKAAKPPKPDKAQQADERAAARLAQQQAQRDLAVELVGKHFIASNEGNYQPYRRHPEQILELMPVMNLGDQVALAIGDEAEEYGVILDGPTLQSTMAYWRHYAERLHEAPPVRRKMDEPGYCLSRPTIQPDASVPCPTWMSFYDRLWDPEAVGAFIAMTYYKLAPKSRQVLWISEEGQGGKSEWLLGLTRLIGERVVKSLNHEQMKNSRFFSSACIGKSLVFAPDCMNPRIIMTGVFKEITGHDLNSTEAKFQAPRDVKFEANAIIISNLEPDISRERHNYTRTLWVKLRGLPEGTEIDGHWGDRLDAEAPGMLAWAMECYKKRCTKDYEIVLNATMQAEKDAKVREFEERFHTIFNRYFVADPKGTINGSAVYELLAESKDGPQLSDLDIANLKRWWTAKYDIERHHASDQHYYKGVRLKTPRDRRSEGETPPDETILGDDFVMPGYAKPATNAKPYKANGLHPPSP